MNNEEFRGQAHGIVDWMADYLDSVERYPVRAAVRPGEIAAKLPAAPPNDGHAMEAILGDFERDIVPGITHWQHPRFFAYFPANSSPPSVLAEMLTATIGAQCMLWQTSPAATEMETRMLDWLRQMIGLPTGFSGVIQDSASGATLVAILTAREKLLDWRSNEEGLFGQPPLAVYCSAETHSSIEKAATIAGLGRRHVRKIAVDGDGAMRPEALAEAIVADQAAGIRPCCVVATIGSTGTGACDPIRPISEICATHRVWLHVDAAWAGSALILEEHRHLADGAEAADSFVFNPHKWLFTNFDCSAYFVRDEDALVRTFEIMPEYLKSREGRQVIDYRDWGIPLGRRFRALKLWFVIRAYGVDRLKSMVGDHIAWTHRLAETVDAAPDFELMTPPRLALFTFRYHPQGTDDGSELDSLNARLLQRINDDGRIYLTQTLVERAYVIRFAVGQRSTEPRHLDEAWAVIQELAADL